MEKDWLEARLAEGRSIESIAKEVGKHPSTVGALRSHDSSGGAPEGHRAGTAGGRQDDRVDLHAARSHDVHPQGRWWLSLSAVPFGGSRQAPPPRQGRTHRGGWWSLCALRLRPVPRGTAVPSRRARGEGVRDRAARCHAIARGGPRRGTQVRVVVRQLPRRGRGRDRYTRPRPADDGMGHQRPSGVVRSGVAQLADALDC
jgi:hypothetical protein